MTDHNPGKTSGYQVLGKIATGERFEIFHARAKAGGVSDVDVAVKIISKSACGSLEEIEDLIESTEKAVCITHPNIVRVFEMAVLDDGYVVVMELVDGLDLKKLIENSGTDIPPAVAVHIVREVCKALDFIHNEMNERGEQDSIVCKNLCPTHILVSKSGEVKILNCMFSTLHRGSDIATEKLSADRSPYISPEEVFGCKADSRSDIFSVGLLFYELLTGANPFRGETISDSFRNLRNIKIDLNASAEKVPPELLPVLEKALARDPGERYSKAKEMISDLDSYLYENESAAKQLGLLVQSGDTSIN